jgi:hypothetical protein
MNLGNLVPIKGYENRYLINKRGDIYSIKRKKFIKEKVPNKNGYFMIGLWVNYKHKQFYVHRLIALTFIPNPKELKFVNHKNSIRTDNRIENLEWCTKQENSRYVKKHTDNKSKYKNVHLNKTGKYTSRIYFKGKNLYLGQYLTPRQAAIAYNQKAKELFGKFALLNEVA